MPQPKRYPYQTTVMIKDDDGDWIDSVAHSDGMTKAQVLRSVITVGLEIIEASKHPEALLAEEPYKRSEVRYGYRAVPILSQQTGEWIDATCTHHGADRSIVIRTAITLGRVVVERRRQVSRHIAA